MVQRVDHEIETTRRMIEALKPLAAHVPELRRLNKELEAKERITAAVEWRVKDDSANVLESLIRDFSLRELEAKTKADEAEAEKVRLQEALNTLKASEPAQRAKELAERAAGLSEKQKATQAKAAELRISLDQVGGVGFPADGAGFVAMRQHLDQVVRDADGSEEDRASTLFVAQTRSKDLRQKLEDLDDEIEGLRESGSHLPPDDLRRRARIAQAVGLKNSDLPYVGELVDVAPNQSEWRHALEKLLRTYTRRMLIPAGHASRVMAFVNATDFKARVRMETVPPRVTRFTMGGIDPRSASTKLRVKPGTLFSDWLWNSLSTGFDHACFHDVADYERFKGKALTIEGLVKGAGDYHEKRDDIEIRGPRDFFLGWDNEEKLRTLLNERAKLEQSIADATRDVEEQRNRKNREKSRRDFAKAILDRVENFEAVDVGSVNRDLAALAKERQQLTQKDPEAAKVEKAISDANEDLTTKTAECKALNEAVGGIKSTLAAHRDTVREIDEWRAGEREPTAEDLKDAAQFFTIAPPNDDKALAKWTKDIDKSVQSHFGKIQKQREDTAIAIKGVMSAYLSMFETERKILSDSIEAADAFLERLRQLEEERLHELQERFREYLKDNLALHVTQLKTTLESEVGKAKARIEAINKILALIPWEEQRVIQIQPRSNEQPEIREFVQLLGSASAPLFAPSEEQKNNAFAAVKELIKFLEAEHVRKVVLDARNWTLFAVWLRHLNAENSIEQRIPLMENTDGLSGGQKNKLSVTLLASALAYQFDVAGARAMPGTFRTVLIDEAFAKLDSENARYALELFKKFDFQLILVHPLDGTVRVAEDYVQGFLLATIRNNRHSALTSVPIEDFKRLVSAAEAEKMLEGGSSGSDEES